MKWCGSPLRWAAAGYNVIMTGGSFAFSLFAGETIFLAFQDYAGAVSRDGGRNFDVALRRNQPIRHLVRLKGSQTNAIATAVCDRNANCAVKRLGRFRPY